jgi:tartrate dehydrogenase/decarboxylase/D-malate dehydrogenase
MRSWLQFRRYFCPVLSPFDQYANVRPTRSLPGIQSPLRGITAKDLDWVIVRENSEGEYSGQGGRSHRGLPEEVGTEVSIYTRVGVTRIMRFAFALARSRPRKLLTVVTKSNAQRHGMVMWDEIAAEVARDFPDVTWGQDARRRDDRTHDAQTRYARHDRSDKPACGHPLRSGGGTGRFLGIAPTANLNPEGKFPSMFEPIHGSAFDITGKGAANPIGAFWTGALLLEHVGEKEAAPGSCRPSKRSRRTKSIIARIWVARRPPASLPTRSSPQ